MNKIKCLLYEECRQPCVNCNKIDNREKCNTEIQCYNTKEPNEIMCKDGCPNFIPNNYTITQIIEKLK